MKVQSVSPFELNLPAHSHGNAESPADGKLLQSQENTASSPSTPLPNQNRPIDAKSAAALVNGHGVNLRFKADGDSGVRIIEIVDRDSGDVVGQIPSEQVVEFLRQLKDQPDSKGSFVSRTL